MNPDPMRADARLERRKARLGANDACVFCGETDPNVMAVHHASGRHNDHDLTLPACLNDHARAHAAFADAGIDLSNSPRGQIERLRNTLASVATFLHQLADRFLDWVRFLSHLLKTGLNCGACGAVVVLP